MPLPSKPGVYARLSFPDYQAIQAVNCSGVIKPMIQGPTPRHAQYAMTHPREATEAFSLGDAVHAAILEPERFAGEYVEQPKFKRNTIAGKASLAEWSEVHRNHAGLLPDDWALCIALRDATRANPAAAELLAGKGRNEFAVLWTDEATGLLCKGRIDRLTTWHGYTAVVDVKTAKDAAPFPFAKAVGGYLYHVSAAFYLDGLNALAPMDRRFIHIAAEKSPPYCVALYELSDSAIEEGRRQYRRALDLYAKCVKSGEWPGYPVGVEPLDLNRWDYELTLPPAQ